MDFKSENPHGFSFADLTAGTDPSKLADFYGVSIATIRRWKRDPASVPTSVARLTAARFQGRLAMVYGSSWSEISISDGGLHIPCFKRPFSTGELRESFWRLQELGLLRHQVEQLKKELERAQADIEAADYRAAYYRGLVSMEARLGLALAHIGGISP